jgi:putative transcriptional regulator
MKLGNNIRRLRFENNEMSQEELATSVGVTRQTIHAVEKGKFVPSALLAFRIARLFRANVEDVFYLTDENDEV